MSIKARLGIDDDRWAKHSYGVEFDDEECNARFKYNSLNSRDACYRQIEKAKAAGYEIDPDV